MEPGVDGRGFHLRPVLAIRLLDLKPLPVPGADLPKL